MKLNNIYLEKVIIEALEEDIGFGDLTTDYLIPSTHRSSGKIIVKEDGVVAGVGVARSVFEAVNSKIEFKAMVRDGDQVRAGDVIIKITGPTAGILKGERTALNFMQRLSGIATKTCRLVTKVKDFPVRVVDTRKTTPTLRQLEKYAVRVGGGYNHRFGLYDAVMVKDNHIKAAGGIKKAVTTLRRNIPHTTKIEVEVTTLTEVEEALEAGADIIMLDNMDIETMAEAVKQIEGKALVEASGGIDENTIIEVARTGVDVISVGALTHQIESLDISLNLDSD